MNRPLLFGVGIILCLACSPASGQSAGYDEALQVSEDVKFASNQNERSCTDKTKCISTGHSGKLMPDHRTTSVVDEYSCSGHRVSLSYAMMRQERKTRSAFVDMEIDGINYQLPKPVETTLLKLGHSPDRVRYLCYPKHVLGLVTNETPGDIVHRFIIDLDQPSITLASSLDTARLMDGQYETQKP